MSGRTQVEHARAASPTDLGLIASLWAAAVAELDGQRGGALLAGSLERPEIQLGLEAGLRDPDRFLVLGYIDEVPVGFASAFCDRARREPVCSIEIVYVEPEARQVGVAEAIVSAVMTWSRGRGCVGVDAPALPGSRPAKAFFEDNGFVARLLIMHRATSPDA